MNVLCAFSLFLFKDKRDTVTSLTKTEKKRVHKRNVEFCNQSK